MWLWRFIQCNCIINKQFLPETGPSLWSGRSKSGPAAVTHENKSSNGKLRIILLEKWHDKRGIFIDYRWEKPGPRRASIPQKLIQCFIAFLLAWLGIHQGQKNRFKKLGTSKPKTSFLTFWSGTRHKWLSVYTHSLPVKKFLPSKLLPYAQMITWESPGTLSIRHSHVSHLIRTLDLQTDTFYFLSSKYYSCNLIILSSGDGLLVDETCFLTSSP